MKKRIAIPALLLAALMLAAALSPLCLPRPAQFAASAAGGDGYWYAENGPWHNRIYQTDPAGNLRALWTESAHNGNVRLAGLCAREHSLWLLRLERDPGEAAFTRWSVACRDTVSGLLTELGSGRLPAGFLPQTLTLVEGVACVTGVDTDGNGLVYAAGAQELSAVLEYTKGQRARALTVTPQEGALRVFLDDGTSLILGAADSGSAPQPQTVAVTLGLRMRCNLPAVLAVLAAAVALGLLLLLGVGVYRRGRRLAARLTAVAAACLLLASCATTAVLCAGAHQQRLTARLGAAENETLRMAQLLGTMEVAQVLNDDFYAAPLREELYGLLAPRQGCTYALYAWNDQALTAAVAPLQPYGAPADALPMPQSALLLEAGARGTLQSSLHTVNGQSHAALAAPVQSSGVTVAVLLVREDLSDLHSLLRQEVQRTLLTALLIAVAAIVLLRLLLGRALAPIAGLTRQMETMATGDFAPPGAAPGRDELGQMSRSLQELCVSLSIRTYEEDAIVRSYQRFVPRSMTGLLGRGTVMETGPGDRQVLTGAVGLLSVLNREQARTGLTDAGFAAFVSDCYDAVRESLGKEGTVLSTGFDLGAIKLLYRTGGEDALQTAERLAQPVAPEPGEARLAPDFFLLLHKTSFLYGLTGSEEEVFPFLSSRELEYLGALSEQLGSLRVPAAMTEEYLLSLKIGCANRYIGFVTSPDGQVTHKLYELLTAQPALVCNLKLRYDERFQAAIRHFYQNDFYLARNIFSALLRICPEDGVARWYLFACERFFNTGDSGQIRYNLFAEEA